MTLNASEAELLARTLDAHEPFDEVEHAHMVRIREFCAQYDNPFDRSLREGHLTGSAFVVDRDHRLLLTHHRKLGIWIQLGGHADDEREAHRVALREAQEESGLEDVGFDERLLFDDGIPRLLDVDVHVIPARKEDPEHEHLDLRYLMVTGRPESIARDVNESRALAWVSLDRARELCDSGIRRALARLASLGPTS